MTEIHPLQPFLPPNAVLLMLGSFPPKQNRWSMEFYYPNMQNDMWRIFGLIFFHDKDHFLRVNGKSFDKEKIIAFLKEKGIALSDTATEVIRQKDNASDKHLDVVTPVDLHAMLAQIPECRAIAVTGQKAMDTILTLIDAAEPKVGDYSEFTFEGREMRLYRMPSSSRAYPKPIKTKAESYAKMFHEVLLFNH
ncbi:MAG: uracil-DNA glycosylase family protein [Bacteroidales bacterium]